MSARRFAQLAHAVGGHFDALLALRLEAVGQRSRLVPDVLLERVHPLLDLVFEVRRVLEQALFETREPAFVVAHLHAEEDVPHFVQTRAAGRVGDQSAGLLDAVRRASGVFGCLHGSVPLARG